MAIQSGHGSTLAFGTTVTFSPCYTTLGGFETSRETLDASCLATQGSREKIEGDLFDVGEMTNTYLFDAATLATGGANSIDDLLFEAGEAAASESITITLPDGASISGDGHVTSFALEELTTDTLIAASITTIFNSWPTFAATP